FLISAYQSSYSLRCQPVDYSNSPLAMRMAGACWWFFFSKIIDTFDTIFFILRKKNSQVTFLHVYHHGSMILNWWLGAKYTPGGQVQCEGHIERTNLGPGPENRCSCPKSYLNS
ncbi:unnamed protein product, partial [Allacma fusca]